jgi:hypothetical protein
MNLHLFQRRLGEARVLYMTPKHLFNRDAGTEASTAAF